MTYRGDDALLELVSQRLDEKTADHALMLRIDLLAALVKVAEVAGDKAEARTLLVEEFELAKTRDRLGG